MRAARPRRRERREPVEWIEKNGWKKLGEAQGYVLILSQAEPGGADQEEGDHGEDRHGLRADQDEGDHGEDRHGLGGEGQAEEAGGRALQACTCVPNLDSLHICISICQ